MDYEESTGRSLPRDKEVDHKNNKGRAGDDRKSNLRVVSKSDNVAMENKRRAKKKAKPKKKGTKKA